jgi:hypothetical protein
VAWIEELQEHGSKATKDKRKQSIAARPRPPVREVYITIRGAIGNDPGEIAAGYFIVEDGMLMLTDQNGQPIRMRHPKICATAIPGSLPECLYANDGKKTVGPSIDACRESHRTLRGSFIFPPPAIETPA